MTSQPRFTGFGRANGGYESYYLRAVDPAGPRAIWLRHTIHKEPDRDPVGSIWLTLWDAEAGEPVATKQSYPSPGAVPGGVTIGQSTFGPAGASGGTDDSAYDIRWTGDAAPLRHLPREWMYRAPLPRTKLESPRPSITLSGEARVGGRALSVDGWLGMVGHNWGAQHAERWIWLHGTAFDDVLGAWADLAFGRIKIGPVLTPWVINGVICVDGRPIRVGGPAAVRGTEVREDPLRLDFEVPAEGAKVAGTVHSPRAQTVVWRYADPDRSEHHSAHCSVATIDLVVTPHGGVPLRLHTAHCGCYELGMRETDHGLPVQPFPDP